MKYWDILSVAIHWVGVAGQSIDFLVAEDGFVLWNNRQKDMLPWNLFNFLLVWSGQMVWLCYYMVCTRCMNFSMLNFWTVDCNDSDWKPITLWWEVDMFVWRWFNVFDNWPFNWTVHCSLSLHFYPVYIHMEMPEKSSVIFFYLISSAFLFWRFSTQKNRGCPGAMLPYFYSRL